MDETTYRIPLIGEEAPSFKAKTTMGTINFPDDYKGKWVILFSHPALLSSLHSRQCKRNFVSAIVSSSVCQ